MLEVISYFVIPVLVILVVAYFYVEMQKQKAKEENKKAILLRIATIKNNFKADLKRLVEQQILTIKEHESVYRIANNFFVFQPVTPNSISYCELLLKNVISAMPSAGPDAINLELAQGKVSPFIRSLPVAASAHNAAFYRNELPELIKQLVDSQQYMYEIDNQADNKTENSLEESQPPESVAAA